MTTEHPLIDQVARAIFDADEARLDDHYRQRWDKQFSQQQKLYKDRARAAIAATLYGLGGLDSPSFNNDNLNLVVRGIWQTKIMEARKEIGV